MHVTGLIVASVMFVLGLIGTVLPILPGELMVFAGTVVYGFMAGFPPGLDFSFYLAMGLAALVVFVVDYVAVAWGTKKIGGSREAVLGSILGIFLGLLVFGPLGIIIGPFLGAFFGEYLKSKDSEASLKAAVGTPLGFLGGTALKLVVEILMIIWFFIVAL